MNPWQMNDRTSVNLRTEEAGGHGSGRTGHESEISAQRPFPAGLELDSVLPRGPHALSFPKGFHRGYLVF